MSGAYCDISPWLLFSSLVLTIVALVLAWRDSATASIICLGFVLLQVVVASLTYCPSVIDPMKSSIRILGLRSASAYPPDNLLTRFQAQLANRLQSRGAADVA
jgi:hypothetical protein